MPQLTTRICALAALATLCVSLAACGTPSGTVVSVGGKAISKATFEHRLGVMGKAGGAPTPDPPTYRNCIAHLKATSPKPAKGKPAPSEASLKSQCEQQYSSAKQQVLSRLISDEWVLGEAEEEGVKMSDQEVIRRFNTLKNKIFPQEQAFQQYLSSSGATVSDMLLQTKVSALAEKLQEKAQKQAAPATEAQIASYYNGHISQYGHPETRDLRIILTGTLGQAEQAKREIQGGKSFADVAKRLSIDQASKNHGGLLRGVAKGQQEKALDEAVFAAKRGVLSGPIETQFGYYVFTVQAIHAGSQQPLAQVKTQIRQLLRSEGEQNALAAFARAFEKRWRARTDCRPGYVVVECKQYKAPSTPTNTVTPTSTGTIQTPSTPAKPRPKRHAKK